jgi:hypothetical protein
MREPPSPLSEFLCSLLDLVLRTRIAYSSRQPHDYRLLASASVALVLSRIFHLSHLSLSHLSGIRPPRLTLRFPLIFRSTQLNGTRYAKLEA